MIPFPHPCASAINERLKRENGLFEHTFCKILKRRKVHICNSVCVHMLEFLLSIKMIKTCIYFAYCGTCKCKQHIIRLGPY